ncbi:hypothetical protein DY000_02062974 [Brassica cretica]|uniref:Uncharacterized protein n=1 Tax=Brassica cretica TaxID=69181 RepID=A0ABQ7AWH2_BRACR|nr:hypothetical protein DY000_02062974 [Brassica cretica]
MTENMKWVRYDLRETASKDARSLRSDRAWLELGRYVATGRDGRSVATQQPSLARARSLRSDRAGRVLGRYVATELGSSSVAT